jgi:hypothetical protein
MRARSHFGRARDAPAHLRLCGSQTCTRLGRRLVGFIGGYLVGLLGAVGASFVVAHFLHLLVDELGHLGAAAAVALEAR